MFKLALKLPSLTIWRSHIEDNNIES